jgi:hypothetical protein
MMVVFAYLHIVGGGISVVVTLATTSVMWLLSHLVTKPTDRPSLMNTLAVAGAAYWVLANTLLFFGSIKRWKVDADSILIITVARACLKKALVSCGWFSAGTVTGEESRLVVASGCDGCPETGSRDDFECLGYCRRVRFFHGRRPVVIPQLW